MNVNCNGLYEVLAKQTHLLIAGKTGSGKSVIVNGIMKYLLGFTNDSQFILIDPKKVELYKYSELANVIYYADDRDNIRHALDGAVNIMEQRFIDMRSARKTMYTGGNIYVIIDEAADLMTTDKNYCKPLLQRIAQLGRAAKVHLILCTQRPVNSVIPIDITCNIDSRVALKCAKAQDSRNIIGESGAELLPKYGSCLYISPDVDGIARYKVVMEDERSIDSLIASLPKKNSKPGQTYYRAGYSNSEVASAFDRLANMCNRIIY